MMNTLLMQKIINEINADIQSEISIMEVCGTHTQALLQYGIPSVLNPKIKLLSGPGCPVCVTDELEIDGVIEIINKEKVQVVSFGDILRVPGNKESLMQMKEKGKDIKIIYSPLEAIFIAENSEDIIVFFGVGFETTAPLIAATIKMAKEKNIHNLFFYIALKRMEPILNYVLSKADVKPDGIICPGHVAVITGSEYFNFIVKTYQIPAVVSGFELQDIIMGIFCLAKQINNKYPLKLENFYKRCVSNEGNQRTQHLLEEVFEYEEVKWRGIGKIPKSGFKIKQEYAKYDAKIVFSITRTNKSKNFCQCGDVLIGKKNPYECIYFNKICSPNSPKGPCMVSREGVCYIYYTYRGGM